MNDREKVYKKIKKIAAELSGCECEQNINCLYKQLQRAKAELEQYKKSKQTSYEAMQEQWNNAVNELRDVKAENEKLKERLKNYVN